MSRPADKIASRPPRVILFLPALVFVIALIALFVEGAPFLSGPTSAAARFVALETNRIPRSWSLAGQQLALNDCLEAMAGPYGKAQPTARRATILKSCQSFARMLAKSMPSHATAWFVAARASSEFNQYDALNLELSASRQTAPNELWLAELRVDLAEDNWQHLTMQSRKNHEKDLALLASNRRGAAFIANRYVTQPSFRERITQVIETLPAKDQVEFLNNVRAATR